MSFRVPLHIKVSKPGSNLPLTRTSVRVSDGVPENSRGAAERNSGEIRRPVLQNLRHHVPEGMVADVSIDAQPRPATAPKIRACDVSMSLA